MFANSTIIFLFVKLLSAESRKGTYGGVVVLVSNPTGSNSIQPLHVTFDLNLKLR